MCKQVNGRMVLRFPGQLPFVISILDINLSMILAFLEIPSDWLHHRD